MALVNKSVELLAQLKAIRDPQDRIPLVRTSSQSAARRQPRVPPPREQRVPPAVAVAEVIREKGPTRVQSGATAPPAAARAQRFYHKYEHWPMISMKVKFITVKPISVNEANIGRY
ncbi:unnamed protein product [Pleuronectes platessa]|uniref:Uncharacterized protein n=1 Tax=Pleuronectes platessa TaxID=8262 RepID=A0A9N7U4B1_PLEPL|nr:unnamed protein product [Pleuronectes platessa]